MAVRYVYSGAAGAGTGADWANAHITFAAAITAGAAGDTYYVAHDHSESTAGALTLTFKGTDAAPDRVYCVNRAGTVPPVAADLRATAVVANSTTAALTLDGVIAICYGVIFNCGVGATGTASIVGAAVASYDSCQFKLASTGTSSRIQVAAAIGLALWKNCSVEFASVSQGFSVRGMFEWRNDPSVAPITGATIPTSLVVALATGAAGWRWRGLDLSALGAGKTILGNVASSGDQMRLANCKLHASVTIAATPANRLRRGIDLIGCDSGATVARNERYRYQGTLVTETTIVRTNGATDGTTAYSWKAVTTAGAVREDPFETFEGLVWNDDTGAPLTLTVHTVTDNVTLTDAEIWLEVDYLADAATPVSTLITDAPATVLTAGANQAASTETWTTTGLTTPVKQKLEVTFTPNMIGPVRWRVKVAKASTTVYICPKAELA